MPSLTERSLAMADVHEGGCLCGALRYRTIGEPMRVAVCHCTWCQRRTGSAFSIEVVYPLGDVTFAGEALRLYRHVSDESGRWLDQHFCATCGANLGFTLEAVPGIRTLAAGSFDDPSWITPERQKFRYVYLRSAREWSQLPDDVERYEEHFRR
jgi:hypothetical protein